MRNSAANTNCFPTLSLTDFKRLGSFIHSNLGIKMPDQKKGMVESRLRKRLKSLSMESYSQYIKFLFSPEGVKQELPHFIDAVTTNKTDFFREPNHFEYLIKNAVPELIRSKPTIGNKMINVWSSACSRGDEPYTLAMVLDDFLRNRPGVDFSITATDISLKVLETGARGVYDQSIVEPVPLMLKKKYLLKSRDRSKNIVRISPCLRKKIQFRQLNLMNEFRSQGKFDVIFCRNVTIYFDKSTTDDLMKRLISRIHVGGYLFMGHSELLDYRNLPVIPVASTVYQKTH